MNGTQWSEDPSQTSHSIWASMPRIITTPSPLWKFGTLAQINTISKASNQWRPNEDLAATQPICKNLTCPWTPKVPSHTFSSHPWNPQSLILKCTFITPSISSDALGPSTLLIFKIAFRLKFTSLYTEILEIWDRWRHMEDQWSRASMWGVIELIFLESNCVTFTCTCLPDRPRP